MTRPRKAVNGYKEILIKLLETSSTNPASRGSLSLFTELPRRGLLGNSEGMKKAGA
jgi:hypothetical protein